MTGDDWESLVIRIDGWWGPPNMTGNAKGAWFDAIREYQKTDVLKALVELARKETRRPSVALIVQTIAGQVAGDDERRSSPPDKDPLGLRPDGSWDSVLAVRQHSFVMAALRRVQTDEHRRRLYAVLAAPRRLTMAELQSLMSCRACSPDKFDDRLAGLIGAESPKKRGNR